MNSYQFKRDKLLENAKNRYHNGGGKEKVTKNYEDNKKVWKEKARNQYRKLSEEEKEAKWVYGRKRYKNMTEDEKNKLKEYKKTTKR